jgi:hypothetical protein
MAKLREKPATPGSLVPVQKVLTERIAGWQLSRRRR